MEPCHSVKQRLKVLEAYHRRAVEGLGGAEALAWRRGEKAFVDGTGGTIRTSNHSVALSTLSEHWLRVTGWLPHCLSSAESELCFGKCYPQSLNPSLSPGTGGSSADLSSWKAWIRLRERSSFSLSQDSSASLPSFPVHPMAPRCRSYGGASDTLALSHASSTDAWPRIADSERSIALLSKTVCHGGVEGSSDDGGRLLCAPRLSLQATFEFMTVLVGWAQVGRCR